jgi:hypothetical protein
MTDDLDEATYKRIVLQMRGEDPGEERPAPRAYGFEDPDRFERWARLRAENAARADAAKAKAEPRTEPAPDWAALDDRMANFVVDAVGPVIDRLAGRHNELAGEIDKEREARTRLEDRCRELLLEQSKSATTIARLEVELARLELRLANGGDRRGGSVIDASPTLKSVN